MKFGFEVKFKRKRNIQGFVAGGHAYSDQAVWHPFTLELFIKRQ